MIKISNDKTRMNRGEGTKKGKRITVFLFFACLTPLEVPSQLSLLNILRYRSLPILFRYQTA